MPSACDSLVDDIEDMVTSYDPTPHERQFARRNIVPRARKQKQQPAGEELQTDRSETQLSHAVMLHCAPLFKLTQYNPVPYWCPQVLLWFLLQYLIAEFPSIYLYENIMFVWKHSAAP